MEILSICKDCNCFVPIRVGQEIVWCDCPTCRHKSNLETYKKIADQDFETKTFYVLLTHLYPHYLDYPNHYSCEYHCGVLDEMNDYRHGKFVEYINTHYEGDIRDTLLASHTYEKYKAYFSILKDRYAEHIKKADREGLE